MRQAERRAIAGGTTGYDLMRRAAGAVAAAILRVRPDGPVLVLCGPGNNGGDGYVAARLLADRGVEVSLAAMAPRGRPADDAARAAADWDGPVLPLAAAEPERAALVVDALFGTGLSRDLDGRVAASIRRLNAAGRPVLAVDIPSGIDADTGAIRGEAVRAARTVTFACRKPGHLLYPGRAFCGEVEVAEIGVASDDRSLAANHPCLWRDALAKPAPDGHKYGRGHAVVVSGGPAHTGAARLAARGALRAGAGLVSVATSADTLPINAAHLTAIMLRVCDDPAAFAELLQDRRFNALLLGPALGIGEGTRRWVEAALVVDRATVLDADALTSFSGRAGALRDLVASARETPVVLTPHEGEFKRLFAGDGEALAEAIAIARLPSKLERARRAAAFMGAAIVLKGADTVVAAPDGRAVINENGTPYLGTAGSGDVLGGIACGLMAQGMPGFEAAAAAVWLHAEAGRRFGAGLIAEDLPERLPGVLRSILG